MQKTVFMIHGMWGGGWYWKRYRSVLEAAGYRCIAPTLPFHDMDPDATPDTRLGTTSLLDYAAALESEIEQLDERPIIMGHSMGGLLAQMLAARDRASALVLLAPAAPAGVLSMRPSVLRSFMSMHMTWGFWRKPMRQTLAEALYSMLHLLPESEQRETYDRFVYESGRAASEIGYWFLDRKRASRVDASKVRCPVLVIAGSEDRITPASVVSRVAAKYGDQVTLKVLPDHAHWLVAEPGWQKVAEVVRDWLVDLPVTVDPVAS